MLLLTIAVSIVFTKALCTLKSSHSFELVSAATCIPSSLYLFLRLSRVTGSSRKSHKSFFVRIRAIGTFGI